MKKRISAFLLLLSLLLCSCNFASSDETDTTVGVDGTESMGNSTEANNDDNNTNNNNKNTVLKVGTDEILNKYLSQANALEQEIINSDSTITVTGTKYYVSQNGNNSNDGKSELTAWKTLSRVNVYDFNEGDGVFLERGSVFEGTLECQDGVTYAAYGVGNKPIIKGTIDANETSDWIPTEKENIYKYRKGLLSPEQDVGRIIFNGGDAWGTKVMKYLTKNVRVDVGDVNNGLKQYTPGEIAFKNGLDLCFDLEFYHDPNTSELYLYCEGGNPAERFDSIEIVKKSWGIKIKPIGKVNDIKNVTIDNIHIHGFGAHGIEVERGVNIRIQYCVLSWIGGSIQMYKNPNDDNNKPTRFGNAIQNWDLCDGFYIDHCYAYQYLDCAWSSQWQGDETRRKLPNSNTPDTSDIVMKNIEFTNNLAKYGATGPEVWNTHWNDDSKCHIINMKIQNNYNLYMGYGATTDHYKNNSALWYGNTYGNVTGCDVSDNVLLFSKYNIHHSRTMGTNAYNFHDNIYIVEETKDLGYVVTYFDKPKEGTYYAKLTDDEVLRLQNNGSDVGSEYYVYYEGKAYEINPICKH